MVIIQADLADGHDLGMFGIFTQGRAEVGWGFHHLGGMPANGGIHRREFPGQLDCAFTAAQAGSDGNYSGDTGGLGTGDDFGQVLRVIGIIEVRVSVVKNRRVIGGHWISASYLATSSGLLSFRASAKSFW